MKRKLSIRAASRAHARRRAQERFAIQMTRKDEVAILEQIHAQTARLVCRESHSRMAFAVNLQGHDVVAIYHCKRKVILTVMPLSYEIKGRPAADWLADAA